MVGPRRLVCKVEDSEFRIQALRIPGVELRALNPKPINPTLGPRVGPLRWSEWGLPSTVEGVNAGEIQ